jgi:uncharacterized protein (DUF2336 family)
MVNVLLRTAILGLESHSDRVVLPMTIVRDFLQWLDSAPANERAEAAGALARAYLCSDLTADELAPAEGLMLRLLDDPSPLVRRALADALAASPAAPAPVIIALACDQPQIAAPIYALSPLLIDADLVDGVATGGEAVQAAIASRATLASAVAAALAELGSAEACQILAENDGAEIAPLSIERMVERFGDVAVIRDALLARDDLPAATRQNLVTRLSQTLAGFVVDRSWLEEGRARRIAREACEKATVAIAADRPKAELRPLIRHLRGSGQLNAGLVLRALLSGNVALFEEALAELSGLPLARVSALVHDRVGSGLRPLFEKARLPASMHAAFKEAVKAMGDGCAEDAEDARLQRRMVERVLAACENADTSDVAPLITLLRRFATEAAREEARLFCDELAADPPRLIYSAAA